jgi:hypothetical protein
VQSYLETCANNAGIDLSTSSDEQRLEIYKCTLRAIRDLPDTVRLDSIRLETLNTIDIDLRLIIQGLSNIGITYSTTGKNISIELIQNTLRKARVPLATATVQYKRDDSESAEVSDAIFERILIMQIYIIEALGYC